MSTKNKEKRSAVATDTPVDLEMWKLIHTPPAT